MRNSHVWALVVASVLAVSGCTGESTPGPTPTPTPSATAATGPTVPIVDSGEREGATGAALHNTNGEINRYIVAPGDSALHIMGRFGLDLLTQLVNADDKELRSDTVIYAGETLTLLANSELSGDLRVVDGGPIAGAMGQITVSASGDPLTYTVVQGDSADLIRKRFDIWWDQLADANGLRLAKYPRIEAGQVLTFTGSKVAFEQDRP